MNQVLGQWLALFPFDQIPAIGQAGKYVVQTGDDNDTKNGSEQHASQGGSADGTVANGPGSRSHNQGDQTRHKGKGGHQDGSETNPGPFDGRFQNRGPLLSFLHGKLHDQYGVFTQ